ncbi:hypothetical protein GQ43DRAFT_446946 [Delitschia confertaspora ATCC 74209]|uniref:Glycosyl hydrolase family 32 n=1 Tax=Delitschia confertaspora ATCC 74209 TaxID=1513339 RepID=A0A9P4JX25_9PLEO|nr:hypothetical protein GQ43DRAFT_446946 [Delitschia confertaspora ATCC 74209]
MFWASLRFSLIFGVIPAIHSQEVLESDTIKLMSNKELFTRWRPTTHIIAPAGWLNWHPNQISWGNISWASDLVTWTDVGGWQDSQALAIGPVIKHPPDDWNVTSWRDPFFLDWPEMDDILLYGEPHYYAVFGSRIREFGPRLPFYSTPASDLTHWHYLGPLWEPAKGSSLGNAKETGPYGGNFEVASLFSLEDDNGDTHYYRMMGVQSGNTKTHNRTWSLWNEGNVSRRADGYVQFWPIAGGAADWGNLYALISFDDTKNNRRVAWGWANDELPVFAQLFVMTTEALENRNRDMEEPGNSRLIDNGHGSFTAYALGIRPLLDVIVGIREEAVYGKDACGSSHMEVVATFSNFSGAAGLAVVASPGGEEYTHVYFDPGSSIIVVDRSHSSTIDGMLRDVVQGHFQPYIFAKSGVEDITMDIFFDGSLLEVFVNDRFALTIRIYPGHKDSTNFGVYIAEGASVEVSDVEAWVGLKNVWPE